MTIVFGHRQGNDVGATGSGELCADTVGTMLSAQAGRHPDAATVFPGLGQVLSLAELDAAALTHAHGLLQQGVRPGDIVGLLAAPGPRLLVSLFGILRAGAAVTILPTPVGALDPARHARRLAPIVHAARMRTVVADTTFSDLSAILSQQHSGLRIAAPTTAGAGSGLPQLDPHDAAVVQFTSGSTRAPRGVVLTHRGVTAGLSAIVEGSQLTPRDILVQWVPQYHDMGLFGLLANLLNGGCSHVFDPFAFLRRPDSFLRYLAEQRASLVTGPNFGYDLLIDAVEADLVCGMELSRWRLAFNGAEPVSAATVRRFHDTFSPAGVGASVMYPVYGMAEVTLAISFPEPGSVPRILRVDSDSLCEGDEVRPAGEDPARAKELVSVGRPVPGMNVRIVDGSEMPCPEGRFGEIQVCGPAVMAGYLHDRSATAAAFDGSWLRSGDLGFLLDGELFVAGRRKEIAIVHGRNVFPEDAEAVARDVPGVYHRRCVAAPGNDDRGEHIAVIVETELPAAAQPDLVEEVRRRVASELDLHAVRVHVVEPRWLTRTSSGKWQRLLAMSQLSHRPPRPLEKGKDLHV